MKEKKGTINLAKFVGIRPNARIGNKEFVFAIETEERKYILRAADLGTKNTWLAKLCELCGQGMANLFTCSVHFIMAGYMHCTTHVTRHQFL